MNLSEKLENIELKIRQLAQKMERLQVENGALLDENKRLKAEIDRQKGTVGVLKNKLELTQQAFGQEREDHSNGELKEQIDQYIQEIDKCIDWIQTHC